MPRFALGWILLTVLTSMSGSVRAQSKAGGSSARSSKVVAERQRLRIELDRLNAEIDALKRDNRGLRDDYRLRSRMADAEAVARRLTEIDAGWPVVAPSRPEPRDTARAWVSGPEAKPSDDSAVLEAKADILADQARRLARQADTLAGRVTDLRARNELRRHAGQLERDPFSPLEQAKRRLATTGSAAAPAAVFGAGDKSATPGTNPQSSNAPTRTDVAGAGPPPPAVPNFGAGAVGVGAGVPGTATTAPASGVAAPAPVMAISATVGSGNKAQPSLMASAAVTDSAGSLATQFREILDASTLAEIRRLEVAGSPAGNLAAMEWALAALRARAAQVSANAKALRDSAKAAH
jgi:hypothetical protein